MRTTGEDATGQDLTGAGLTGEDRTAATAAGQGPAEAKAAGRDRPETTAGHDPSTANANGRAGVGDGATARVGVEGGATGQVGAGDDGRAGAGDDASERVGREDDATGRPGADDDVTAPSAREPASAVPASGGPDAAGEPEDAGPDRGRKAPAVRRAGRPRFRTAVAVALLLALAGGALQVMGARARHLPATRDRALVDAETTALVIGDVGNGLCTVFSYAPGSTAATEQAAGEVLGGAALSQYRTLFAQVKQRAAAERLTVTTHVVRAGVTDLSGRTAHVLVFLDQVVTRRDRPQGTPVAAQLSVTARLDSGHWRIIDINAL